MCVTTSEYSVIVPKVCMCKLHAMDSLYINTSLNDVKLDF
jgi:hypothetical protein